jgi:hypothetical protein
MIVSPAIFTCSICGEASSNICAYCTKDTCSNHRCERCKRCSDCCECEYPLSAEEPAAVEAVAHPAADPQPEIFQPEPQAFQPEPPMPPLPVPLTQPGSPVFFTAAESSVFVEGSVLSKPPEPLEPIELEKKTPQDAEEPIE